MKENKNHMLGAKKYAKNLLFQFFVCTDLSYTQLNRIIESKKEFKVFEKHAFWG
jgi:hypothetical protein